ncbi:MAG: tRNA (N6-threonylcarbamoyladenosine(37)-N6)-methyltransferase TrmO [Candidatus Helarchaeota archaeon]
MTEVDKMTKIEFNPIGVIHSPYKHRAEAPFQGIFSDEKFELEFYKEYIDGLKDIEGFSHIVLLYYAHKSRGFHLQTTTPWDTTLHGVFTTFSPIRPNAILLSVVPLLERKNEYTLIVSQLDAIDGTPILDIKPYVPSLMVRKNAQIGWMHNKIRFSKKERKEDF